MAKYFIIATVGGVWVQYVNEEFENSTVAKVLASAIGSVRHPDFRCFAVRDEYLADIVGKSADEAHGVIVYSSYNTHIV